MVPHPLLMMSNNKACDSVPRVGRSLGPFTNSRLQRTSHQLLNQLSIGQTPIDWHRE